LAIDSDYVTGTPSAEANGRSPVLADEGRQLNLRNG